LSKGNIPSDTKAELLKLLAGLKSEIKNLSETHHEEASSDLPRSQRFLRKRFRTCRRALTVADR
jgi:hypothetical protein